MEVIHVYLLVMLASFYLQVSCIYTFLLFAASTGKCDCFVHPHFYVVVLNPNNTKNRTLGRNINES